LTYTRHKADPQSLATLTKEIRRLSLTGTMTPGTTPPTASNMPHRSNSGGSTGHDSAPQPVTSSSYRSDTSNPSTPEGDHHPYPLPTQRCPTPPPRSVYLYSSPHPAVYPTNIRPPPAVARLAGKEKRKTTNAQSTYPTPTSHPAIPKESQGIGGIMSWAKNKDTKNEKVWEPGVIGRERARAIVDGKR